MNRGVRLLLGPAGSGKTYYCLQEIRSALLNSPTGRPLVLVTPKQTTYQLERQLLSDPAIPGYTRLYILSFERLAAFIFDQLHKTPPHLLDEQGRLMVLRSLLAKVRPSLQLYRASSRLAGFAQELALLIRELMQHRVGPEQLLQSAAQLSNQEGLALKLRDLAALLKAYLDWLGAHQIQDADFLLSAASAAVEESSKERLRFPLFPSSSLSFEHLWVDGFAEWSPQELDLIAALIPNCERATLTFCLENVISEKTSWLSTWSVVRRTFEACTARLDGLGLDVSTTVLERTAHLGRFGQSPVLRHLEQFWTKSQPFVPNLSPADEPIAAQVQAALRVAVCSDAEAEVILAAREILRYVRQGGRFRDVSVFVRKLEDYHPKLERIFPRYEIPYFLDRRQSVSHHPLAELTRGALRTIAFQWRHEDWFCALKSGLIPAGDEEIDRLENEAMARGWQGPAWHEHIEIPGDPELSKWVAKLKARILLPFVKLAQEVNVPKQKLTGPQLSHALRTFWQSLRVETKLDRWTLNSPGDPRLPGSVHATVWEQMNNWLASIDLAFATESLSLHEWLPVLETALSNFTVGVIPPALDQVLIGAVDRSRNPDVKLALVLGMNEGVFPAKPQSPGLLTDSDLVALEQVELRLGATARQQLAREHFLAYTACTRSRSRLVLTSAAADADGNPLNPSPFISEVRKLFPDLACEHVPKVLDWRESEHPSELAVPLFRALNSTPPLNLESAPPALKQLLDLPALGSLIRAAPAARVSNVDSLPPELALRLYGPVLRTSVSRMEQFAACPFKFFVDSGLRAQERRLFKLDVREQGSFQHELLARFHLQLQKENLKWRQITPEEARMRLAQIAGSMSAGYREGLLHSTKQSRFTAEFLTESLQDFVATVVDWMRSQYEFDPIQVELPFGREEPATAWRVELAEGTRLELAGRIDRVDVFIEPNPGPKRSAFCVVMDYKSSHKQLDAVSLAHGLQLQLLAYLNALARWPDPQKLFGVDSLVPVGAFFINLRGRWDNARNRRDALANPAEARKQAFRHSGRFDITALPQLDSRSNVRRGDQFNYRFTKANQVHRNNREALQPKEFEALLGLVQAQLQRMGREILAGTARIDPFKKGSTTACAQCSFQAICRIDPWTHSFRTLSEENRPDLAP